MSDQLLLQSRDGAVVFEPPVRPASATLSFRSPAGSEIEAPAVTLDTLSRAVTAVTNQTTFATSGTGTPQPNRRYWWVSSDDSAHAALVRVSEYDAGAVTLAAPIAGSAVKVGDTLVGARLTATIDAESVDTRGRFYQLEWTVTGTDGIVRVYQQTAHVVRTQFQPAVLTSDAAEYIATAYPSHAAAQGFGYFAGVAERASDRVWRRVRAGTRWFDLLGSTDCFRAAGEHALRIELAHEQMLPPGTLDVDGFIRSEGAAMDREINDAISGAWYDTNGNGSATDDETRSTRSTPLVRR